MLYYTSTAVTFREVPDQISRCFSISECGNHCEGCHSPELQGKQGEPLTREVIESLVEDDALSGVNTYVFLGEGNDREALRELLEFSRECGMMTCLYTGSDDISRFEDLIPLLNYIKVGHYDSELGGLDKETTNQRFYIIEKLDDGGYERYDLTYVFREDPLLERKVWSKRTEEERV